MVLWVLLSLAGAVIDAVFFAAIKHFLNEYDQNSLASVAFIAAGAFLLSMSAFLGTPLTGDRFVPAVSISIALNLLAIWFIFRALSTTDLSLSMPILSFTPMFLIVSSYVIHDEFPHMAGLTGIFLIVLGSYIVNTKKSMSGIVAPFAGLFRNRGVIMMLIVALIFSILANVDKIMIQDSDPLLGPGIVLFMLGVMFFSVSRLRPSEKKPVTKKIIPILIVVGILFGIEIFMISQALLMQIVPYVISLKRTSILFAVIFGGIFFHEENIAMRFAGSVIMVAGIFCIIMNS